MLYISEKEKKEGGRIRFILAIVIIGILIYNSAVGEKGEAHTNMTEFAGKEIVRVMTLSAAAYTIETENSALSDVYYDVPLNTKIQDEIRKICEKYGIEMELILAMIKYESGFDQNITGDNENSFGLMQIQPRWHSERMKKLGVTDIMDPCQNVTVGADLMAQLISYGKGTEWALMAYNGGEAFADYNMENGIISNYVSTVLEYKDEIEESAKEQTERDRNEKKK